MLVWPVSEANLPVVCGDTTRSDLPIKHKGGHEPHWLIQA